MNFFSAIQSTCCANRIRLTILTIRKDNHNYGWCLTFAEARSLYQDLDRLLKPSPKTKRPL